MKRLSVRLLLITTTLFAFEMNASQKLIAIDSFKVEKEPINYAEHLWFESKVLAERTSMNVYLPASFHDKSTKRTYPVVFINGIHGEKFFLTLSGIVKHLGELDRMPESIVVSLNHSGHTPMVTTNGMWNRATIEGYGDPIKYSQHLKRELFPYLRKHYRANDYRMLVGVSGSAIYPAFQMTHEPELFNAYIFLAAADIIGMGFKKGVNVIDSLQKYLQNEPLTSTTIYMAMADDDLNRNDDAPYSKNLQLLETKLATYRKKNLRLKVDIIPNERHYAAFSKAILSAMEYLFPEKKWAPKYRNLIAQPGDALHNIDAFYQALSKDYGFEILPKAVRWNSVNSLAFVADKLINDGRLKEALAITQRRIEYQPFSAAAYHQLSKALEANNEPKAALEATRTSVKLAKHDKTRMLDEYKQRLENLKVLNQ